MPLYKVQQSCYVHRTSYLLASCKNSHTLLPQSLTLNNASIQDASELLTLMRNINQWSRKLSFKLVHALSRHQYSNLTDTKENNSSTLLLRNLKKNKQQKKNIDQYWCLIKFNRFSGLLMLLSTYSSMDRLGVAGLAACLPQVPNHTTTLPTHLHTLSLSLSRTTFFKQRGAAQFSYIHLWVFRHLCIFLHPLLCVSLLPPSVCVASLPPKKNTVYNLHITNIN